MEKDGRGMAHQSRGSGADKWTVEGGIRSREAPGAANCNNRLRFVADSFRVGAGFSWLLNGRTGRPSAKLG